MYLQPKSSLREHSVEYLSYDTNGEIFTLWHPLTDRTKLFLDLIGDIGGYLGLFLGWSLVTFYDAIPLILTFIKAKTKKKSKMQK